MHKKINAIKLPFWEDQTVVKLIFLFRDRFYEKQHIHIYNNIFQIKKLHFKKQGTSLHDVYKTQILLNSPLINL